MKGLNILILLFSWCNCFSQSHDAMILVRFSSPNKTLDSGSTVNIHTGIRKPVIISLFYRSEKSISLQQEGKLSGKVEPQNSLVFYHSSMSQLQFEDLVRKDAVMKAYNNDSIRLVITKREADNLSKEKQKRLEQLTEQYSPAPPPFSRSYNHYEIFVWDEIHTDKDYSVMRKRIERAPHCVILYEYAPGVYKLYPVIFQKTQSPTL
ncbi:MAG: hypothetical protein JWN76_529 [Chitinophagaceae bacterium]|nr:hypothetical protein [Chitinophagaceae bacterium]